MHKLTFTFVLAPLALAVGCGEPAHIQDYTRKTREPPTSTMPKERQPASEGSLWRDDVRTAHLFADARAFQVADIVVVEVEEKADAQRSRDTDIGRTSRSGLGFRAVPVIGPLAALLTGDLTVDVSGDGNSDSAFKAEGKTGRSESLIATVPAVVQKVLPNGNLIVEGHRVILVNEEEQHLYVSGIVRPIDIDQNNTIQSSQMAEAEIEFVGRGILTDNSKQGWFTRYFGWIWPF